MTIPGRRQQNGIGRLCFGMLLILALMLRASIPDGFMPAAGKAGLAQMTICPGVAGILDGEEGHKDRSSSHSAPCAFTLVLAHGALGQAPVIPAPVFDNAIVFVAVDSRIGTTSIKPWLSRGPPYFLAQT